MNKKNIINREIQKSTTYYLFDKMNLFCKEQEKPFPKGMLET